MMVDPDDRGFTLGDGLFETILADHGRLEFWQAHIERLLRGCTVLGLPKPDPDTLRDAALAALNDAGLADVRAAVRISWSAGRGGRGLDRPDHLTPSLVVTAAPAPRPTSSVRLAQVAVRRNERSPASRLKTLAYIDQVLARREASQAGADDALMLNGAGNIACASAANIFWLSDGILRTPSLECGVLDGVMRGHVIGRSPWPVREVQALPDELAAVSAIFLTNSLIGVRNVKSLDGRLLDGEPHAARLQAAVL